MEDDLFGAGEEKARAVTLRSDNRYASSLPVVERVASAPANNRWQSAHREALSDSLQQQVAAARRGEVSQQELAATLKEVQQAGSALSRQQGGIDAFRKLSTESDRLADRVRESGRALREFSYQLAGSATITAKQEAEFRRLERAYQQAQAAQRKNTDAIAASRTSLQAAGIDTRNLAEAQRQIVVSATTAGQSATVLTTAMAGYARNAREAAQATRQMGQAGRQAGTQGFLGLRPHEIQNLGYQVNDLFTQIASGTSAAQAFAQQGGQIFQVFGPGAFSAVARWIPMIATLGTTVGVTAAALGRLYDTQTSSRNFSANVSLLSGEGGGVTGDQLTAIARYVQNLGFRFDDTRKAALAFLREGLAGSATREWLRGIGDGHRPVAASTAGRADEHLLILGWRAEGVPQWRPFPAEVINGGGSTCGFVCHSGGFQPSRRWNPVGVARAPRPIQMEIDS